MSYSRPAPQVLRERDALLKAILDTAVDGIITIDPVGTIESVNPAAEEIFGYSSAEMLGRNVSMLMPAPYRDQHNGFLAAYLKTGQPKIIGLGREVEGRRKNGTVFPIDLAVSEVRVPDRLLFAGIVRDISDRRLAEEEARVRFNELAHAARLLELGEMTAGIAHEVNQPLTAIVSFAQACLRILEAEIVPMERIKHALREIATQGARAS